MVPCLNLFVIVRCYVAPEGYHDHGQLDTAGKIMVGVVLIGFILGVLPILG